MILMDSLLGKDAEGEIRTPEGFAAHQISSLARLTGLRYLSGLASSDVGNTFSPRSSGGEQRHRIELDCNDRLHESVRVENPRMDLAESTDLASLRPDGGRPARDEVVVLHGLHVRVVAHVTQEAEHQGFRFGEGGFVVHRRGRYPSHVARL